MRWKFWDPSVVAGPYDVRDLRRQVESLTKERDQALDDSRRMRTSLTMTRVGQVSVDPAALTAALRRVVPHIRVELIGYTLVILANQRLEEAEFRGIEALCPFTIDRT